MNLSHLYYFKKLAEVQHYTRAAKELFIAQPTLSAAISQLEKELGAPLFQKHTRSVHLTSYGQDFYRYVNVALQNLDKGIDVVQQRAGVRQSSVRVGAVGIVQDKIWSRGIRAFRENGLQNKTGLSPEIYSRFVNADASEHFHVSAGGAIRFILNHNFVLTVEYGKCTDPRDGIGALMINSGFYF